MKTIARLWKAVCNHGYASGPNTGQGGFND